MMSLCRRKENLTRIYSGGDIQPSQQAIVPFIFSLASQARFTAFMDFMVVNPISECSE